VELIHVARKKKTIGTTNAKKKEEGDLDGEIEGKAKQESANGR